MSSLFLTLLLDSFDSAPAAWTSCLLCKEAACRQIRCVCSPWRHLTYLHIPRIPKNFPSRSRSKFKTKVTADRKGEQSDGERTGELLQCSSQGRTAEFLRADQGMNIVPKQDIEVLEVCWKCVQMQSMSLQSRNSCLPSCLSSYPDSVL